MGKTLYFPNSVNRMQDASVSILEKRLNELDNICRLKAKNGADTSKENAEWLEVFAKLVGSLPEEELEKIFSVDENTYKEQDDALRSRVPLVSEVPLYAMRQYFEEYAKESAIVRTLLAAGAKFDVLRWHTDMLFIIGQELLNKTVEFIGDVKEIPSDKEHSSINNIVNNGDKPALIQTWISLNEKDIEYMATCIENQSKELLYGAVSNLVILTMDAPYIL